MKLNTQNLEEIVPEPLIQEGWYECTITSAKVKDNATSNGQHLLVVLKVNDDTLTTYEGKEISNSGKSLFYRIGLEPTENYNPNVPLSLLADACGIPRPQGIESDGNGEVPTIKGKSVRAKVAVRQARTDQNTGREYDASNEVKGLEATKQAF
jgi:hypothetical protein